MRKILLALIVSFVIHSLNAQNTEKITVMGNTYTVSKAFPKEIIGEYTYEGNGGAPKVLLNQDGSGYFQPHDVAPVKIKFWIDCEPNGDLRKQIGGNGRYQYTLIIQYLEGGTSRNYEYGKYDLMGVTIVTDMGRAVILGERYKSL